MPEFDYSGRDRQGQAVTGKIEASTPETAATLLFEQGIIPIKINVASEKIDWKVLRKKILPFQHVKTEELIIFCRQMYSLYKAGVPILSSIARLTETARSKVMKEALETVLKNLQNGRSLTIALSNCPQVFPSIMVNLVQVGENTGKLDIAFLSLSEYLELEETTIKRIKSATRYPMIVVISIIVAMIILNIFVIPAFAKLFEGLHAQLPWATRVLLAISNFMVNNWGILLILSFGILIGLKAYVNTDVGRYRWNKLQLRLPVVGSIFERILFARFSRAFALVLKTDIALPTGIELVAAATNNAYMRERILQMRTAITHGESIMNAAINTRLFSPLILQMLNVGEETGAIDEMLEQVAEFYEREVDFDLRRFNDLIEPILLVIIGIMVLILALGIFLPMWNLTRLIAAGH